MKKKFYVTTPIYYVNGEPHIGHAYTGVACDIAARFKRLQGYDVRLLTGTDEHGQKVEKSSKDANIDTKLFIDKMTARFLDLVDYMNISYDDFIRTSEDRHKKTAKIIWGKMFDNGHVYLDKYAGWYAVRDESYYGEDELINGKAPTGAEVQWVEEPSYFFDLSKWQNKLLKFYDKNPDFIAPESRRKEIIKFVEGGLKDLSISRTGFDWGIKIPNDDKHVMYVWLDALSNYISALDYAEGEDKSEKYKKYWPADLHIVGKDIIRFHAVYWPAFLMAADLPVPKRVFAHGWWKANGEKMSKSLNNAISPKEICDKFGLDYLRYFFARETPFGQDGNYSEELLCSRVNSDLCNKTGNFLQRVLSMIYKNCSAQIPVLPKDKYINFLEIGDLFKKITQHTDKQEFHLAVKLIIEEASKANIFIDEQKPWILKKTDKEKMRDILAVCAEKIRQISILLLPYIPDSADLMLDSLSTDKDKRDFSFLDKFGILDNVKIEQPRIIFKRPDENDELDNKELGNDS